MAGGLAEAARFALSVLDVVALLVAALGVGVVILWALVVHWAYKNSPRGRGERDA